MCRIIGAVGKELDGDLLGNVFLELEHLGRDATGFWFPNTNIVKEPKKVTEFLPEHRSTFDEGIKNSNVFIGHTRLATHGKPEFNYNNHPLQSDNGGRVHHGIVYMQDINDYDYKSNTDSENILAYIEKFGLEKGLEYCTSGASIILVNKNEENTLYTWKTFSSDMVIAYDMDKENIYIVSEEDYLWKALEWKKLENLGGLFNIVERKIYVVEPKSRELWKIQLLDGKIKAEMIADIPSKYTHSSGWGSSYGYSGGRNTRWIGEPSTKYAGGVHWKQEETEEDKENKGIFVKMRDGAKRPIIREEKKEKVTTNVPSSSNGGVGKTTQKQIVKPNGDGSTILFPGDVVSLKREIQPTDMVTAAKPELVLSLAIYTQFRVKRLLVETKRIVVTRSTDGEVFVVPSTILKKVEPPVCMGISYNPIYSICQQCSHEDLCVEAYEYLKDMPQPNCIGSFNDESDDCMSCLSFVLCLAALNSNENGEGFIDAEFKEINDAAVGQTK